MTTITEADVEKAALEWLSALGWRVVHGPDIAPGAPDAERGDYGQVVLDYRLRDALASLNPSLPDSALDDAFRRLTLPEGSTTEARNRAPFIGCLSTASRWSTGILVAECAATRSG